MWEPHQPAENNFHSRCLHVYTNCLFQLLFRYVSADRQYELWTEIKDFNSKPETSKKLKTK